MAATVCFTGAAADMSRSRVIALCGARGILVSPRMHRGVDLLVNSRADTTKYRDAIRMGVYTTRYQTFFRGLEELARRGHVIESTRAGVNAGLPPVSRDLLLHVISFARVFIPEAVISENALRGARSDHHVPAKLLKPTFRGTPGVRALEFDDD